MYGIVTSSWHFNIYVQVYVCNCSLLIFVLISSHIIREAFWLCSVRSINYIYIFYFKEIFCLLVEIFYINHCLYCLKTSLLCYNYSCLKCLVSTIRLCILIFFPLFFKSNITLLPKYVRARKWTVLAKKYGMNITWNFIRSQLFSAVIESWWRKISFLCLQSMVLLFKVLRSFERFTEPVKRGVLPEL